MPEISPPKLVIVDDEVAQMKALCNTLKDRGYETVGFSSPHAVLAEWDKMECDLLLTDLMMPEMSGIELLQAALKRSPNLVGIIMTGEGTIATAVEAMKSGALDYILKPFKLGAILPVLDRALAVRRLRLENAALTKRVQERTEQLEAANKELEAFSYTVSHDLRAPLRSIDGFANILQHKFSSELSPEAVRLLTIIGDSVKHMGQLIDSLLRFSHLGRQELYKKPVKISALVEEVVNELQKEQNGRRVEVKMGNLPDCDGDGALLRQVFVNLLSNAFKFTRQKDNARIEVGCERQGESDIYFVKDNGAGFDMNYAQKLFGVFQRLHPSSKFEGTGIGLSIVQRIIQRHGGKIWAEAQVDHGASFYFTLASNGKE